MILKFIVIYTIISLSRYRRIASQPNDLKDIKIILNFTYIVVYALRDLVSHLAITFIIYRYFGGIRWRS